MENRVIFFGDIPKTTHYNDINSYYNKYYIGGSDIAELTVYGYAAPSDNASWIHRPLHYGGDGEYHAHIIRADGTPIPEHYKHRFTFYDKAIITEDSGDMVTIYGKQIDFYRAGEMGTLIAVTKFDKDPDFFKNLDSGENTESPTKATAWNRDGHAISVYKDDICRQVWRAGVLKLGTVSEMLESFYRENERD